MIVQEIKVEQPAYDNITNKKQNITKLELQVSILH